MSGVSGRSDWKAVQALGGSAQKSCLQNAGADLNVDVAFIGIASKDSETIEANISNSQIVFFNLSNLLSLFFRYQFN